MFGLFNSTQRKATEAAVEAVRPLIATVQAQSGLPNDFWLDPYILGFLSLVISFHARQATEGKAQGEVMGHVLADTFTAVSNANGAAIVRRLTALQQANDPEANRGANDAAVFCFYVTGILKDEVEHPLVKAASQMADASTDFGGGRWAQVAAMIGMLTLLKHVREESAQS